MQGLKNTAMLIVIAVATNWCLGFPTAVALGLILGHGGRRDRSGVVPGRAFPPAGGTVQGGGPTRNRRHNAEKGAPVVVPP